MKEIIKQLKKLTGCGFKNIADKFGVSKQYVHSLSSNYSLTHKSCLAYMLNTIIDENVDDLKLQILQLEMLKVKIHNEVIKNDDN